MPAAGIAPASEVASASGAAHAAEVTPAAEVAPAREDTPAHEASPATEDLPAHEGTPPAHPATALCALAPGGGLVSLLQALEPADVDDSTLVESVVAWERVVSWATARQHLAVVELLRRACGSLGRAGVVGEVGAALAVSPRAAQLRVEAAEALTVLPEALDALEAGEVDPRRAATLVRETEHLGIDAAREVVRAVLPGAGDLTVPALARAVRRHELVADPEAQRVRHASERRRRCVRMVPAPDAMARLHAYLPATDAVTVMTALGALASATAPDDQRSTDERRADALTDLALRVLDRGTDLTGAPLPRRNGRHPHVTVVATASSVAGTTDEPAELGGYGLIPAALARHVIDDAPRHVVLTDVATGRLIARSARAYRPGRLLTEVVTGRDVTCTFPGCRVAARWCDVDHIDPYDHRAADRSRSSASGDPEGSAPLTRHAATRQPRPDTTSQARPESTPQTRPDNLHALCRHHHRLKTHGGWDVRREAATGVSTWRAPSGRGYSRDPVPYLESMVSALGEGTCGDPPGRGRRSGHRSEHERWGDDPWFGDVLDGGPPDLVDPDVDRPEREPTDIDAPAPDAPDGDAFDVAVLAGGPPDLEEPDGDGPDGDGPDGDGPDGDGPDGDCPDGERREIEEPPY